MLKRLLIGWFAALALVPLSAHALGLGGIEVQSSLTETMDAVIEVVGAQPGDAVGMQVRLAPIEHFRRAGIDRGFHLTNLRFSVQEDPDTELPYIKVGSRQAVREPLLNFIVELSWGSGQIFKEYVVFLDPPGRPDTAMPLLAPAVKSVSPVAAQPVEGTAPEHAPPDDQPDPVTGSSDEGLGADGSYGPVQEGDTLWRIASRHAADPGLINSLMLAIVEANPDAFVSGNANRLIPGTVLRLPDTESVARIGNTRAVEELQRQREQWLADIGAAPTPPAPAGEGTVARQTADAPKVDQPAPVKKSDQQPATVRLVRDDDAAGDAPPAADGAATGDADVAGAQADERLFLLEEQLDSQRQENDELRGQISALEQQLATLRELVAELEAARDAAPSVQPSAPIDAPAPADAPLTDDTFDDLATLAIDDPLAGIVGDGGATLDDAPDTPAAAPGSDVDVQPVETPAAAPPPAVPDPAATPPPPQASAPPPPPAPAPGLMDRVMANIVPIGGGLVILLGLVFGLRFLRGRRSAAQDAEDDLVDDGDVTAVAADRAPTVASDPTDTDDADATVVSPQQALDTGSEDIFDGFVSPTAGAAAETEIEDVDPIAEADVYLAYGRHQQAEEILQEAMQFDPQRVELKLKLLEIYYSQKKADEFAAFAQEVQPAVGSDATTWDKIRSMGNQLAPDNPLFAGAQEVVGDVSLVATTAEQEQEVLDLGESGDDTDDASDLVDSLDLDDILGEDSDEGEPQDSTFLDLEDRPAAQASSADETSADGMAATMTMTVGDEIPAELGQTESEPELVAPEETSADGGPDLASTVQFETPEPDEEETAAAPGDEELPELSNTIEFDAGELGLPGGESEESPAEDDAPGMSLEFDLDDGGDNQPAPVEDRPVTIDDDMSLDFDSAALSEDPAAAPEEAVEIDADMSLEFEIGGTDVPDDDDGLEETVVSGISLSAENDSETMQTLDAIASKLDLLAAYVDMGDRESAENLVNEIREHGNEEQVAQAEALLSGLE